MPVGITEASEASLAVAPLMEGPHEDREARCMCLFEATGPELVKELNEQAKIPFTRIVEAMDLTP
jgi:hypothetical protein